MKDCNPQFQQVLKSNTVMVSTCLLRCCLLLLVGFAVTGAQAEEQAAQAAVQAPLGANVTAEAQAPGALDVNDVQALKTGLGKVAINNEVLTIIVTGPADPNILRMFYESLRRTKVDNFASVCTDDKAVATIKDAALPDCVRVIPRFPVKAFAYGSAVRYQIVWEMVKLNYSVLNVDYDMVFFKNPFTSLRRDTDIETMTDAVTHEYARGTQRSIDAFSEHHVMWSQPWQFRVMQLNCGCSFFRATTATLAFMDRFVRTLAEVVAWDQALFTELLLQPAYRERGPPGVQLRVLDIEEWANSHAFMNMLNTWMEHEPVMVHANYHKPQVKAWFLQQVVARYTHPMHPIVPRPRDPGVRRALRGRGGFERYGSRRARAE